MRRFLSLARVQYIEPLLRHSQTRAQNIGVIVLMTVVGLFFAKGIVDNNIRILNSIFWVFILGLFCLRITTGVIALLVFLPFMAFIRRSIYFFEPYTGYDPILLISPILTVFMFGYVFIFHGEKLISYTKQNKLLRYVSYFVILMLLQMFNPLQGGLAVGFAGAMYWIIPFLWFYFGFFISRTHIRGILYMIVIIGIITALYGIHQIYHGFLPFEEYWIKYGAPLAVHVRGFIKAFSTFSNPQEFAHYLMIAGAISFMCLFKKPSLSLLWIIGFIGSGYGIFMTSTRTYVFMFFLFIVIYIGLKVKPWGKALVSNLLFLSLLSWGIYKVPMPSEIISPESVEEAQLAHITRGLKYPLEETSTAWARPDMIKYVVKKLGYSPFGYGLGSTTIAAIKFKDKPSPSELFHSAVAESLGIPGVILFILIMYWIIKISAFLTKKDPDTYLVPATLAIWFIFVIETRLYSTGPFICLLWGWLAKEWTVIQG